MKAHKCPLCGGAVLYQGMVDIECDGVQCPNQSKDLPKSTGAEQLSFDFGPQPYPWFGPTWTP